jgi:putative DNA primase/helicase
MAKYQRFAPHSYAMSLSTTDTSSELDMLWKWKGTHWEYTDEEDERREAYKWIRNNSFEHTSDANAASALAAAKLHMPRMPSKVSPAVIIPCLNEYVHVFDDRLERHPHDRMQGIKHLIKCDYDPSKNHMPLFTNLLNTSLPSLAIQNRVQEYIGYTLIKDARFQRAQIWKGSGANGKGVLANVVQALHHKTTASDISDLKGFSLQPLVGASLIYVDECPQNGINEQKLKSLIAGEATLVDRKYSDPITTKISGKWIILANHMPATKDQSEGFWRRFDIIPFDHTVSENKRIANLADQIINTELSGVLN